MAAGAGTTDVTAKPQEGGSRLRPPPCAPMSSLDGEENAQKLWNREMSILRLPAEYAASRFRDEVLLQSP